MKTSILVVIIALIIAFVVAAWILMNRPTAYLPAPEQVLETPDAMEQLTEGTTIKDIEQDLQSLQREEFLGDLDEQLLQMEQDLNSGGL